MSFSGTGTERKVILCSFDNNSKKIDEISVPQLRELKKIGGDIENIRNELECCQTEHETWLEIDYTGDELIPDLTSVIHDMIHSDNISILRINDRRTVKNILKRHNKGISLEQMDEYHTFGICLDKNGIEGEMREKVNEKYKEVLKRLHEE
jgi:exonuclease SbcD